MINADLEVFITPVEVSATTASNANRSTEELCLVKVYGSSYDETVVSYWEPRTTTKSPGICGLQILPLEVHDQTFNQCGEVVHLLDKAMVYW
jgi:hypothetical protein